MTDPFSKLPPAGQDVLKRAFLTLIHSALAVAVAVQGGVSLSAESGVIIAGLGAVVSILWHGLPALVGAAKAKRLNAKLATVAALEALIRANIAAEQAVAQPPAGLTVTFAPPPGDSLTP